MMEYIPGKIHESFQKEHFFLVNFDFSWINFFTLDETDTIELSTGDVVVVRFFKSSPPTSESYSYLEKVIYSDGVETEYKIESIISREFVVRNTMGPDESRLFTHVTKSFERDKKINLLLNE